MGQRKAGPCEGLRSLGLSSRDQPLLLNLLPQQGDPTLLPSLGGPLGLWREARAVGWSGWKAGRPSRGQRLLLPSGLPLDSVPAGKGRRAFWWPWTEPAQKAVPTEGLGGEGCLLCGVGDSGGWFPWGLEEAGVLGCSDRE